MPPPSSSPQAALRALDTLTKNDITEVSLENVISLF